MLTVPRMTAAKAFWIVSPPRERRLMIEAALERLDRLKDRLIDRLDATDDDPEPDADEGRRGWPQPIDCFHPFIQKDQIHD